MDGITGLSTEQRMELHDELYLSAAENLEPYLVNAGARIDDQARLRLNKAILLFERALDLRPSNWNAMWCRGKSWQILGDHDNAYVDFRRAYDLAADNPDVGRELTLECLALGKGHEAVEVATATAALSPSDHGLIANVALAQLIDGDPETALVTVCRSLALDSSDVVTQNLKTEIEGVLSHQIEAPTRLTL